MVPQHIYEPFFPVVIVEQRRVKTAGIKKYGLRPGAFDTFGGYQVVIDVLEGAFV
jgi:hypothetical protein